MHDYIPTTDEEKVRWFAKFAVWLAANGVAHGFTPAQITAFQTLASQSNTALDAHLVAKDAARAATSTKNVAIGEATALARDYAQKLQHDLNMTDADRANAGLTLPDSSPTPTSSLSLNEMTPPLLLLDFSIRRQVIIHWGMDPINEHLNARPAGTIGAEIQYAIGGIPAQETGWTTLELDTESPAVHHLNITTPTTIIYRARYVGKNLQYGNFDDPVQCTVSV
jgi:hypothetical protein